MGMILEGSAFTTFSKHRNSRKSFKPRWKRSFKQSISIRIIQQPVFGVINHMLRRILTEEKISGGINCFAMCNYQRDARNFNDVQTQLESVVAERISRRQRLKRVDCYQRKLFISSTPNGAAFFSRKMSCTNNRSVCSSIHAFNEPFFCFFSPHSCICLNMYTHYNKQLKNFS